MSIDEQDRRLGQRLRTHRASFRLLGDQLRQQDVAEASGFSQAFISKLEKGASSLKGLSLEDAYSILQAYKFDTLQIKDIIREFKLGFSPEVFGEEYVDDRPPGMVDVLYEGTISTAVNPPQTMRIPVAFLAGDDPETHRLRDVQPSDLATPGAAAEVTPGSYLVLRIATEANDGQLALYLLPDGQTILALHGRGEQWALPLDGAGQPAPTAQAKLVRTVVGIYKRFP